MGRLYAKAMFGEAARRLQQQHGSFAGYARIAERGPQDGELGALEIEFIRRRDSFYIASVTEDGWPYMQHRGGPVGLLKVLDPATLAFADFSGNRQYITAGNFATNDRVSLFLMDYPNQARLKIIGHARVAEAGADPQLEAVVQEAQYRARIERVVTIALAGFDWNCSQHITPRYTAEEIDSVLGTRQPGEGAKPAGGQ